MNIFKGILFLLTIATVQLSSADVPRAFNYHGRILSSSGSPVESESVKFIVKIYSNRNECLLYEETHTVNMKDFGGIFGIAVGEGQRAESSPQSNVFDVFKNNISFPNLNCKDGSNNYTPNPNDTRLIRVSFKDGDKPAVDAGENKVESVPYAMHSGSLQGLSKDDFLRKDDSKGLTQVNIENVFENFETLEKIINGESDIYLTRTNIIASLPNIMMPGTYTKVTVDSKGRVTGSAGLISNVDLEANSVNSSNVINESLTGVDIKDGTIMGADIADDSLDAATKLSTKCMDGKYLKASSNKLVCANPVDNLGRLEVSTPTGSTTITGPSVEIYRMPLTPPDIAGYIDLKADPTHDFGARMAYDPMRKAIRFLTTGDGFFGTAADVMFLSKNRVGIGTLNPAATLDVYGNIAVSGSVIHSSDKRLKEEIVPLEGDLAKLTQLTGYEYFWKDKGMSERKELGLIAQEVREFYPELVFDNESTGYMAVNYSHLVAPIINAVKELNDKDLAQDGENSLQNAEIAVLRKENIELRAEFAKGSSEYGGRLQEKDREIASLKLETQQLRQANKQKGEKIRQLDRRLEAIEKALSSTRIGYTK